MKRGKCEGQNEEIDGQQDTFSGRIGGTRDGDSVK